MARLQGPLALAFHCQKKLKAKVKFLVLSFSALLLCDHDMLKDKLETAFLADI